MPRRRHRKIDAETISLGQVTKSLNIKQLCGILSAIALLLSTTYGFGYTSAEKRAASELILHTIEDRKEQVKDEQVRVEKDDEIKKLKSENEKLKDALANQPRKDPVFIVVVPKRSQR